MIKKGDKVKINLDMYNVEKDTGINNIPFAELSHFSNKSEIIKRTKEGMVATVTSTNFKTSFNGWANLEFEDGFECGEDFENLIKIKKERTKKQSIKAL